MPATTVGSHTPPTPDELREYRRQSFRVYGVLLLALIGVSFTLRLLHWPLPYGVTMGFWFAAVHYWQPAYPGSTPAAPRVRFARGIGLGVVLGALMHWIVHT